MGGDRAIGATLRIPMHNEPPSAHIQHPILRNTRTGVEAGLPGQVEVQRAVSDFDNQVQIFRPGIGRLEVRDVALQNDQVRLRFVCRVVRGRNIDRRLRVHKTVAEYLHQPAQHQDQCVRMRPLLAHPADQLPLYELKGLLWQQAGFGESGAFGSCPDLTGRHR